MELYNVGKIVNTHGLKGELRVLSITDFPDERFSRGSLLYAVKDDESPIELKVIAHRTHKQFHLLTFEGREHIQYAEPLVGSTLTVAHNELNELEEDEFYYHQIIGLEVVSDTGETIGKIKEILSPGANDVWVVQRHKKKDLLLPYIESVVLDVDLEKGQATVHLLEGLDDE